MHKNFIEYRGEGSRENPDKIKNFADVNSQGCKFHAFRVNFIAS